MAPPRRALKPRAPLDADPDHLEEIAAQLIAELPIDTDIDLIRDFLQVAQGGRDALLDLIRFKHKPVSVREFITSAEFMNMNSTKQNALWEGVIKALEEVNSGKYVEAVLTGGIGVAKTTIALYTLAYQLYRMSCYRNLAQELDQDPSAEIVLVIQSISGATAKKLDYTRLRKMIEKCAYFAKHFPFDASIESELRFPQNVYVRPISGLETGAIGENVIGGIIDEINFMAVIEKSTRANGGQVGLFDQAVANYNSIAKRRQSRFLQKGQMPGMLCLVSSRKYPGQFTDKKEEEAKTNKAIYVYDKRIWELRPERFDHNPDGSLVTFRLFKGDLTRKAYVIETEKQFEDLSEEDKQFMIMLVPLVYIEDFRGDMIGSLRDIAGLAATAVHPWITDGQSVTDCFGRVKSVASRDEVDFVATEILFYPKLILAKKEPRFAHIDLAETGDSAGLAIGYVSHFEHLKRGQDHTETLPAIVYDLLLEIKPPKGGSIIFERIRQILYVLRTAGMPIKWVSLDSYQSTDMLQILAAQGFIVGKTSMDKELKPYSILKTALHDRRIKAPAHFKAQNELVSLEYDTKKQKVDHPPTNSKDIADAMAGVAYGLTLRRDVWIKHGIPTNRIPENIKDKSEREQREEELAGKSYMERVKSLRHMPLDKKP